MSIQQISVPEASLAFLRAAADLTELVYLDHHVYLDRTLIMCHRDLQLL